MSGSSKAACLLAFMILFLQDYVYASEVTATRNMTGFPPVSPHNHFISCACDSV